MVMILLDGSLHVFKRIWFPSYETAVDRFMHYTIRGLPTISSHVGVRDFMV
jgi:hypothetical protein